MTTNQSSSSSDILGKVIIYSVSGIPEDGIPYADFDRIAEFCANSPDNPFNDSYGFPREYMPQVGEEIAHAQNAWAQGTGNFPSKGEVIKTSDIDESVSEHYHDKFGVYPVFRFRVIRLKKNPGSNVVKRHLYLDVMTATAGADTEDDNLAASSQEARKAKATKAAAKQLDSFPVALMEFGTHDTVGADGKTKRQAVMRFQETEHVDRFGGKLRTTVADRIERIKDEIRVAKDNANDQSIRAGVRSWLADNGCFAVRGSGGNYFITEQPRRTDENGKVVQYSTEEKIAGLVCYFDELADYCRHGFDPAEIMILDAMKNVKGSLYSRRTNASLMDKATESINTRLQAVLDDLAPVLQGSIGDKACAKRTQKADLEILQIYRDLDNYREAFENKFSTLDQIVELADERIKEARKAK